MIKLEDLKFGDAVYEINKYYWLRPIIIETELYYNHTFKEEVIVAKNLNGRKDYHGRYSEENLFRTEQEARKKMKELRNKQKEEWKDKDTIIKFLYLTGQSMLTAEEDKLIREVMAY